MVHQSTGILIDKSTRHIEKPTLIQKTASTPNKKIIKGETFAKLLEKIQKSKQTKIKISGVDKLNKQKQQTGIEFETGNVTEKNTETSNRLMASRNLMTKKTSFIIKSSEENMTDTIEKKKKLATNLKPVMMNELLEEHKEKGSDRKETDKQRIHDKNTQNTQAEIQKPKSLTEIREWSELHYFGGEKRLSVNEPVQKISRSGRVEVFDRRQKTINVEKNGDVHKLHSSRSDTIRNTSSSTDISYAVMEPDVSSRTDGVIEIKTATGNEAELLAQKLEKQAGHEIVRQVKLVLNKSNSGEIQINLKPEHLGRVRMQIRLEDGHLTGRIFVESSAANQAFRTSLVNLQERFIENGFSTANFDLTWDEGQENSAHDQNNNHEQWKNIRNTENIVHDFEASVGVTTDWIDGRINMIA